MFEDSLVESVGRIRTRSRRYAAGSLLLETALVATIVLIPYLYPDALPRKFLTVPLIAPPPPAAPVVAASAATAMREQPAALDLTAPSRIPQNLVQIKDNPPTGPAVPGSLGPWMGNGTTAAPLLSSIAPAPVVQVKPPKPAGPMHVSSGVAAGQLMVPIRPEYPAIAREAGVQGTVVVAATISTEGRIESLRVVSGPPMLVRAAVAAIEAARYRPWKLNGDAVEVETTINVVFRLGNE